MMAESASFHGYHPVQVVDDVINCFHDCARRRAAAIHAAIAPQM